MAAIEVHWGTGISIAMSMDPAKSIKKHILSPISILTGFPEYVAPYVLNFFVFIFVFMFVFVFVLWLMYEPSINRDIVLRNPEF
ncbi:hypothetical protein QCA50_002559 [Cerrena zonata]|uniref:Uncharacterized protein n=1 Tax=Cerrena zonata TaxID=2478898 RepID=A0AAW0GU97_9APHY